MGDQYKANRKYNYFKTLLYSGRICNEILQKKTVFCRRDISSKAEKLLYGRITFSLEVSYFMNNFTVRKLQFPEIQTYFDKYLFVNNLYFPLNYNIHLRNSLYIFFPSFRAIGNHLCITFRFNTFLFSRTWKCVVYCYDRFVASIFFE